jgi:nucleoside-diphosphate-sugar epimerase
VDTAAIARVLGARAVHVPAPVLRAALTLAWKARLEPLDPGWLDLGFSVPLVDTSRASRELGWRPTVGALEVLAETVAGLRDAASDRSPVLRPRSVAGGVLRALRDRAVTSRREP